MIAVTTPRMAPWYEGVRVLRWLSGDRIPAREVGPFFERLAAALSSGMLVHQALRRAARGADPELQRICWNAAGPVAAGMPLHQALMPWRRRLPEIVVPVLEVGDASGTLESSARRLADAFSRADAFERRFRYSVFDWRLMLVIIPLFLLSTKLYPSSQVAVMEALRLLGELVVAFVAGRLLLCLLLQWAPLRMVADSVKLAVPHLGAVARNISAARWARSFSTLWHAGVAVSYALEVSAHSALNAHYEGALLRAAQETRAGRSLSDSLAATALLPRHLLEILRTGETTGDFGPMLERFATMLEEEALTMGTQELGTAVLVARLLLVLAAIGGMRMA